MPNFVEQHCSENHASQNNLLRIALDVREVHSILNNGDRERSDQCAEHFPFAATETGTANNDGGDTLCHFFEEFAIKSSSPYQNIFATNSATRL